MRNLVLLAVCGYLCVPGLLGWAADSDSAQEQALAAIQKAGGEIKRDDSGPAKPVVRVKFGCGSSVTDADLAHLKSFPDLQELVVVSHAVTDQGLERLKTLSRLQSLTIIHAGITDKGLDHLKGMSGLRKVYFRFTGVTEAGSKELAKALPDAKVTWRP